MKKQKFYLGLDIGTDSVGYAVTDEQYNLIKFHGEPAWGSMIFDAGSVSAKKRSFRLARRRLDRRQQRVHFVQEIFAPEIAKVDERFFIRLQESYKWREDVQDTHIFFNDSDYTDVQYYKDYPTIHHLICELMESNQPHDVRLVYLACAWLVSHRGHFLSNIDIDHLDKVKDITSSYKKFTDFLNEREFAVPFTNVDMSQLGNALKEKKGVREKKARLAEVLLAGKKPSKEISDDFPFNQEAMINLLAGGSVKVKELFGKKEYEDFGSISLGMDEEKYAEFMNNLDEDYEFEMISCLRSLYDWAVLVDVLGEDSISAAKKQVYEQHKTDLVTLKYFVKKYIPQKYDEIFREAREHNYVAYSYHTTGMTDDERKKVKEKADIEKFSSYLEKIINGITPDETDKERYDEMTLRISARSFLPKQRNTDNRVIPHQLYLYEMKRILEQASAYLPFLQESDETGITNFQKLISIFTYKLPYFVGPLNTHSSYAWLIRKGGKIYPWNYKDMIDFDASEQAFIERMTNHCTYLPEETVLPKDSLCYQKFMVLNEINNIKINGEKIPVEVKQDIYHALFEARRKVRRKDIVEYFISNGVIKKGEEETISGIDNEIKSALASRWAYRNLIEQNILSEDEVERIIERAAYAEDKTRVKKWLEKEFPHLSEGDIRYICGIKAKAFGRFSKRFLNEFEGVDKRNDKETTILHAMWETNDNLMEILSAQYTFAESIQKNKEAYYDEKQQTLETRLDEMYVSNAVRRPIYRTLDIVRDIQKAFGEPQKIFIEMTRGKDTEKKGKRTFSRRQQLEEIYRKCREEDVRELKHQLEALGEHVDGRLQDAQIFLYFMQFGKCAYTGTPIILEKLMSGSKEYDIDHIYPQQYVKDDSIINNKVLVCSEENGRKKAEYPIKAGIRSQMAGIWKQWHKLGTISDEKYKRLIRTTPFSDEEKYGFINRQLVETSQSTKAIAELLKERFPKSEIVYTKARLTSEFRQEFQLPKSRIYNDLHHAVDAYLNIVTGNVYHMKFSRKWFSVQDEYSLKTKTLFTCTRPLIVDGMLVWDGPKMLAKVKATAQKNNAHFTKFAFYKKGGLFDQKPVRKSDNLVPLKKGLSTDKYGGYNKAGIMFYIPVRYKVKKKSEIIIMSVELLYGKKFLEDEAFAREYTFKRLEAILKKPVEEVSFPMGMRPWKVNTILSLDGFRVCITGTGNGGSKLLIQTMVQFAARGDWKHYIKRMERFCEKTKANKNYVYDERYDYVSKQKNVELYDLYMDKLENSIYKKRKNSPLRILKNGRESFLALSIVEQCNCLLNIHSVFGRLSGGCDLTLIGGAKNSATTSISVTASNWKKDYSDVRIIDQSPSGLWETKSENLLKLL